LARVIEQFIGPSKRDCGRHNECARGLPDFKVKTALIVATALVVAAIGFDFIAPLLLTT
jgi:mercuric ion transport protein